MFGVSYAVSLGVGIGGLNSDTNDEDWGLFLIPLVGPVAFSASAEEGVDGFSIHPIIVALTLFDTLFQTAGVPMFIAGLATTLRDDDARIPSVHVGPGHVTATWSF